MIEDVYYIVLNIYLKHLKREDRKSYFFLKNYKKHNYICHKILKNVKT